MKRQTIFPLALLIIAVTVCSAQAFAQTGQEKLTVTILHLDSAFWNAYNNCDTAHFKDFFTDDIEFYHDKGGATMDAKSLIEALNKNICGNANSHLRREAVAGTVKVYPLHNGDKIYGAIILGEHGFYMTEKGKPEYHTGDANFTQLWLLKDGVWKMARILSYNHHEPDYKNTRKEIDLAALQLDQLSGIYKSAQSGTMTITRENKLLVLKGGGNTFTLYPQADSSFFTKDRDLIFEFIKDAKGKPLQMIVKKRGAVADELMFQR
jgi:ketosteroid isomerase-like protein